MSIIKKAPAIMTREVKLEEPVNATARRLCPVHREQRRPRHQRRPEESALAGSGLPQVARSAPHGTARLRQRPAHRSAREGLMQRALESRAFISAILAMATGSVPVLHPSVPRRADLSACHRPARSPRFPELQIPLLRAPVHHALSRLLDRALGPLHLYAESPSAPSRQDAFPSIPIPARETTSFLSSAKSTTRASRCPPRLPIGSRFPSADLFTGIAILGAIGSGKTSLLHASVRRTNSGLQSRRQREAHRRS